MTDNIDKTLGILSGSDAILAFCKSNFNFHSWQSVRHWRRKYSLPIRYWPNGTPYMLINEVTRWGVEYDNIKRPKQTK